MRTVNKYNRKKGYAMKDSYMAPEAEIVLFVAEENLASNESTSFLGWDITDQGDGNWANWDKWFN